MNVCGYCSTTSVHQCPPAIQKAISALPTQQQWIGAMLGSLISGLSNCTVNILLQNVIVNVDPILAPCTTEIDGLLDGIELEKLV